MDLGTIKRKLDAEEGYRNLTSFAADVRLVFDNAVKYNGPVRARGNFHHVSFSVVALHGSAPLWIDLMHHAFHACIGWHSYICFGWPYNVGSEGARTLFLRDYRSVPPGISKFHGKMWFSTFKSSKLVNAMLHQQHVP